MRGDPARYLTKVLRIKPGESILLFDGSGTEYLGTIEKVSKDDVQIRILEEHQPTVESPLRFILFQGIPKADKMDIIVKGTTELGISTIIPFFSSRTVPRWKKETLERKVEHWQKIAVEAARQSGRTMVPEVNRTLSFEDLLSESGNLNSEFLKIVLWEGERARKIKEVLREQGNVSGISCIVGPEGGFSPEEINLLKRAGCTSVSLGRRILRSETAAIILTGIIQYECGDFG